MGRTNVKCIEEPHVVNDAETNAKVDEEDQVVTPWEVAGKYGGKIDYDKLIDKFGCQRLNSPLIDRVHRLTGQQPHVFLRRGVFFAHRDFGDILDAYERGEKFYLYTGRGPSSEALHLGHLVPFMFTKYLQDVFKVPLVIQLTDDEKCMWKDLSVEESIRLARENAKDIIACGFDISRTYIFSDFLRICSVFMQAAPSFPRPLLSNDKRCCSSVRNLGYVKPALIESIFFPALQGEVGKMSASDPNSAIYVTDSAKDIKNKVNRYAFSGGQDSIEKHRKLGANLQVDIPVKYLGFFLDDDAELEHIKTEYAAGRMLTGEVKKRLTEVLTEVVERHRRARAAVTDEMVDAFMAKRPLPNMFN
ncbi:hypothetical protein RND81_13G016900 [Saponaria officinalis]|uniref:Tryptophan--tRNA ligase, cytoplasmic n=1 Tax=Saponaria officinalis TaxID=3572 RepID=A0AAW1GVS5_SAPOF